MSYIAILQHIVKLWSLVGERSGIDIFFKIRKFFTHHRSFETNNKRQSTFDMILEILMRDG